MTGAFALIADLFVCGAWIPQAELFLMRVHDTDAQLYLNHRPQEVLQTDEK